MRPSPQLPTSIRGAVGGWIACRPDDLVWQERLTGVVMVALGVRLLLAGDGRPART